MRIVNKRYVIEFEKKAKEGRDELKGRTLKTESC